MFLNIYTDITKNELNSRLDSAKETICEVQDKTQEVSIPINKIIDNKNTHIPFLSNFPFHQFLRNQDGMSESHIFHFGGGEQSKHERDKT